MNRRILIYNLKRVFEMKNELITDVSKKSTKTYFCSKQSDFAITSNAKFLVGRRVKSNHKWEIIKESVDNDDFKTFAKIHKNAITSVNLVCKEKYVMTTGEDGLVLFYDFDDQRQKYKIELKLERVMSTSTLNDLGVIGGRGGFEFIYLDTFKYVNYRDPNKNRFNKLFNSLRGKKESTSLKFLFKCNEIRALCFGIDDHHNNVLIFAGSGCHFLSRIEFKGPFEFLKQKIDMSNQTKRTSRFTADHLKPGNSIMDNSVSRISKHSKRMSFTSMFSFNQTDNETKKVNLELYNQRKTRSSEPKTKNWKRKSKHIKKKSRH